VDFLDAAPAVSQTYSPGCHPHEFGSNTTCSISGRNVRLIKKVARRNVIYRGMTKSAVDHYVAGKVAGDHLIHGETTMQRKFLTLLSASLIAASSVQMASAAERHHARKVDRAAASEQFRNANNAIPRTAPWGDQSDWRSNYTTGQILALPSSAR
jgi:hypothetical protein